MKKLLLILAVTAVACMARADRLPQDPTIRKGVLPNGLTYYIRHNAQTPGVAEFYIAQRVGSILEEPRQRGLAHFLEHMAFNGTEHFPGDSLNPGIVKWCERIGVKFGRNLNAYTSVDETVYNISAVPVSREGIVDSCLLILHDWSNRLLLTDEEIDKERGVIQEEWRARRAGMAVPRMQEEAMPVIYEGTKYADCLPIGSMDIVLNFPYNDLRDYYHKWYRPDLQAVIVVGDIDADRIEEKIKTLFAPIPTPVSPAERIYYPVPDNDRMILYTATDKEQPTVNFTLYMKREATPPAERATERFFADDYESDLIRIMLNDRLSEYARHPDPPLISASARDGRFLLAETKDAFSLGAMLKQDSVLRGIAVVVGEVERTRQYGFSQPELQRAKEKLLSRARNAYNRSSKRRNASFVRLCLDNFLRGEAMTDPETEWLLTRRLDQTVTLEQVNRTMREMITDRNQVVTIYGPAKDGFTLPDHRQIEQTILRAQSRTYPPYTAGQLPEELVETLPKAGTIVTEKQFDHGYTLLQLSNGMNVYVRPTTFENDEVIVKIFSPGGTNRYPEADMPSLAYLNAAIGESGVGRFDRLTLNRMLAGKSVSVRPFVGDDTEGIDASANIRDLPTLFRLAYLYFTAPRRDDNAFRSLMNRQQAFLTNRDANPSVAYKDSVRAILYGNHPRLLPMTKERLPLVSYDRIMQVWRERFANAADFSVIITGNVNIDSLRPLLCRYMASLPATAEREGMTDPGVYLVRTNETHRFVKPQATPSTTSQIYVSAPMAYNAENNLLLDVLAQLLRIDYTEKVREEKGGTYGVSVSGSLQRFPRQEGVLAISFRTAPDKFPELIPIIYERLLKMATDGPGEDDLNKIKAYERKTYEQARIRNDYWQYVLYNHLFNGVDFDSGYTERVEALSTGTVRDFAAQLLRADRRVEVTMASE